MCVCVCVPSRQGCQQSVNVCVSVHVRVCRLFVCLCKAAPVRLVSHGDNRCIFSPTRNPAGKLFRVELKDDLNLIIISNIKESMAAFYESVTAHKNNDVNQCIVLMLFPVLENVCISPYYSCGGNKDIPRIVGNRFGKKSPL